VPDCLFQLPHLAVGADITGGSGFYAHRLQQIVVVHGCDYDLTTRVDAYMRRVASEPLMWNWRRTLRKIFEVVGVRGGHPHRFSDTFAVDLLLAGVPLETGFNPAGTRQHQDQGEALFAQDLQPAGATGSEP